MTGSCTYDPSADCAALTVIHRHGVAQCATHSPYLAGDRILILAPKAGPSRGTVLVMLAKPGAPLMLVVAEV